MSLVMLSQVKMKAYWYKNTYCTGTKVQILTLPLSQVKMKAVKGDGAVDPQGLRMLEQTLDSGVRENSIYIYLHTHNSVCVYIYVIVLHAVNKQLERKYRECREKKRGKKSTGNVRNW